MNTLSELLSLLWLSLKRWSSSEADQYAAALSYFVPFALTPLLLISITWVGIILGVERINALLISWGAIIDPELPSLMSEALQKLEIHAQSFAIPFIAIIFFSVMILVTLNSLTAALHKIWRIEISGFFAYLNRYMRALLAVVLLQVYFVLLIMYRELIIIIPKLTESLSAALYVAAFLITTIFLVTCLFRLLPLQTLPLKSCFYGATITGFLFIGLQSFVNLHLATSPGATFFGAASIVIVMLIWFYAIAAAILFGAAFAKEHSLKL